ncbi:MAG: hypothetical protein ACTHU0_21780 [Kofleriaceae bacterium]
MSIYRCRTTRPEVSAWYNVDAASPEEAAGEFQARHLSVLPGIRFKRDGDIITFAVVEVEGAGTFVVRFYQHAIWRRGGVRRVGRQFTMGALATALGWTGAPAELLEPGWAHEEPVGHARSRT